MPRANVWLFAETLRRERLFIFTSTDLVRRFGWTKTPVRFLLHRYTQRGITVRLRRDLYALSGVYVPEPYVANRLSEPSYVSLETALALHHVIPETVYGVASITTKRARTFNVLGTAYSYHHVASKAFTGYAPLTRDGFTSLVADPEKALVDYCYLVVHGRRQPFDAERARLGELSRHKIERYARLYGDPRLGRLLHTILDQ